MSFMSGRGDSFRSKTVDNIVQNECKIKGQYLTVKMHLFVLQKLWKKKDIPNVFLPRPEYAWKHRHDGSMMKWGETCSCEWQNPTVSYEQFLSDLGGPTQSSRWLTDTCTRCKAHTCCSEDAFAKWLFTGEKVQHCCNTDTGVTHALWI